LGDIYTNYIKVEETEEGWARKIMAERANKRNVKYMRENECEVIK
jgi:hypothetical protein